MNIKQIFLPIAFSLLATMLLFSMINMSYAQSIANLVSNPNFTPPGRIIIGWADQFKNCQTTFKCVINSTTGWKDSTSLQLSTGTANKTVWSSIDGNGINVKPHENYNIVTHMKLNKFATQSHVVVEGFNQTSKKWDQITQCPSGTNGPLAWKEFSCKITIPTGISQIRPVLRAGSTSLPGKEAVTLFDSISISKAAPGASNSTSGLAPSAASPSIPGLLH
jgi:hypothetical protein